MKNILLLLSVLLIGCVSAKSPAVKTANPDVVKPYLGIWKYNQSGFNFATLRIRGDHQAYLSAYASVAFFQWEITGDGKIALHLNNPERPDSSFTLVGELNNGALVVTFPEKGEKVFVKADGRKPAKVRKISSATPARPADGRDRNLQQQETGAAGEKSAPGRDQLVVKTEREIRAAFDRFLEEKKDYASLVIADSRNEARRLSVLVFPRARQYQIETILLYAGEYVPNGPPLGYAADRPAETLPETFVLPSGERKILQDFLSANDLQPKNGYFYQKNPATGQAGYYQYYLAAFIPFEDPNTLYEAVMLFWEQILNRQNAEIQYIYPDAE